MLLRNKQTGEIVDFMIHKYVKLSDEGNPVYAPFNGSIEEWEDVPEEPKDSGYWYYDTFNKNIDFEFYPTNTDDEKADREIGNHFTTREEAEKAVEKLKAWKRLKDKGCRLILDDHFAVKLVGPDATKITSAEEQKSLSDDYKLLFGGKDE